MSLEELKVIEQQTRVPKVSKGPARHTREATLERLSELGIHYGLLAQACQVSPSTYKSWRDKERLPYKQTARIALDRLGVFVQYMEADLGLDDNTIRNFISREPMRTREDRGLELYTRWTQEYEQHCRQPLVTGIASHEGLTALGQRAQLRFPDRDDTFAAGQFTTPDTILHI